MLGFSSLNCFLLLTKYYIFTKIICMYKNGLLTICVFMCIITSCNTESNNAIEATNVNGKYIKLDSASKELYTKILIGNILISQEGFGKRDYYGSIIRNGESSKPELLFKMGHGHNEFGHLVFEKREDMSLLLMNKNSRLNSIYVISGTDSLEEIKDDSKWEKYDLTNLPSFRYSGDNIYSISDSTVLVTGAPWKNIGHIFSIIDYKNQKVLPLKYWPDDGVKIDSLVKHSVYTDYGLVFGNGSGHYLYQCGRERYAFIFEIDDDKVNVIKELYTVYSDYTTDDGQNYKTKSRHAEELMSTTDNNHIYILLKEFDKDGNKMDEWHPAIYGNIIEIYDWVGNIQKIIRLDHYGQRIMLSEDHKKLYLFTDDFDGDDFNPEIWVYNLNNLVD